MWSLLLLKTLAAVVVIFVITNIFDWISHGSRWAYKYFALVPEIWRPYDTSVSGSEKKVVTQALTLSLFFSAMFVLSFFILQPGAIFAAPLTRAFVVGTVFWLLLPVPIVLTQHLFIKYHVKNTLVALVAWWGKLLAASVVVVYLF